jgi:multidrug efflux pump subunit AcrB/ABC-type multidrug transport system ATPase subunit
MKLQEIPVRRPVTIAMLFLALALLGVIAYVQLPVELIPDVAGRTLYVSCYRPGSDPETVERELVIPIEGRIARLRGIEEVSATVERDRARLTVALKQGTSDRLTLLELQRIANELASSGQPWGTYVQASDRDISIMSRFIMQISVRGAARSDVNALRDFADKEVLPRLESVEGVAGVWLFGGRSRVVEVLADEERCEALGVSPVAVQVALSQAARPRRFLGAIEDGDRRYRLTLDGRFQTLNAVRHLIVRQAGPVYLKDVARVEEGLAREESYARVNGQRTVSAVVLKDEAANLLRTGRALRQRLEEVNQDLTSTGVSVAVDLDGSQILEEQFQRLQHLALGSFVIVLLVLLIFLRDWRPMLVMAAAIPASLLIACLLMKLFGLTLNILSMVGLVVGVGMLVDNAIVVFENILRLRERGLPAAEAVTRGAAEVTRAITAGTATNAVVFLPIAWIDNEARPFLVIVALAIVLPLVASLVVALSLVPMLAAHTRVRLPSDGAGQARPNRARLAATVGLKSILRHPIRTVWVMVATLLITAIITLPLVTAAFTPERPPPDRLDVQIELPRGATLEATERVFARVEEVARQIEGVKEVRSNIGERQGQMALVFAKKAERPATFSSRKVRDRLHELAKTLPEATLRTDVSNTAAGGGSDTRQGQQGFSLLGGSDRGTVTVTGPDSERLRRLALEAAARLREFELLRDVQTPQTRGQPEIQFVPDLAAMESWQVTMADLAQMLAVVRREGVEQRVPFHTSVTGDDLPLLYKSDRSEARTFAELRRLRVPARATRIPLAALGRVRLAEGPVDIVRKERQRQVEIFFRLSERAPTSGPRLVALRHDIDEALRAMRLPSGHAIRVEHEKDSFAWFRQVIWPMLFLLFVVLALTFESLELPFLIFVSVPLTLIGALWALVMTGTAATEPMALMGAVCLLGLSVNPAILIVDRMQRLSAGGHSVVRAALEASRDRVRPVLMTGVTTVAGLAPLALKTGVENEIWPPFAIVVIGGLVTSTLLTLLAAPMGFVLLKSLRAWLRWLSVVPALLASAGATALAWWIIENQWVQSVFWQAVVSIGLWFAALGLATLAVYPWKRAAPLRIPEDEPIEIRVQQLRKVYGEPGRVRRQWRRYDRWVRRVLSAGGVVASPRGQLASLNYLLPLLGATAFMLHFVEIRVWLLALTALAWWLLDRMLVAWARSRGMMDERGRVRASAPLRWARRLLPLLAVAWGLWWCRVVWWVMLILVVLGLLIYLAWRTGSAVLDGRLLVEVTQGRLARARGTWRRTCQWIFGLGGGGEVVKALDGVDLNLGPGMWGLLGPNGAGKTTLMRCLCQVLEPSTGTIFLNGHRLREHQSELQGLIGYLPQDFGLHDDLSAREYLEYYALLNNIHDRRRRDELITRLLDEVGLAERQHDKIRGYSGGMRQRVGIARTLLHLPRIVVVDEPTVGLDPKERIRFRNLLTKISADRIVLFSTHVVEDVAVSCQQVAVLDQGRLLFVGSPEDLRFSAQGKVWSMRGELRDAVRLQAAPGVTAARAEHLADGGVRIRIVADEAPGGGAEPAEPTIEEAYLALLGRDEEEVRA